MPTLINEIPKVFLYGETLESEELNEIIDQINSAIRKLNNIENNLVNHGYSSIPITNIYCRTKKGINAINFFPLVDDKRNELLNLVSNCNSTQGIKYNINFSTVTISEDKDLMNGVWTAYPQGISASLPHEWEVSYKKLEDNSIIYVSGPVLYSNYGYNGTDGDSVQYIYKIFDHKLSGTEEEKNTPFKPENPNSDGEYIPSGWKDNPQGPTREYPFEYVAILKKIKGNWEEKFEKISLWSTFSESGDFLTRVFCRYTPTQNKSAPNTPIGGTYNNPLPESNDNIQWSLTIPAEDDNNKGPIWTSVRIFKGTNEITEWSTPVIEADSAEIDIEYSSTMERPLLSTLRNIPNTAHPSNNIWHDPSETNIDLSTMVWRAERKIKNGQYIGNWVITKITGLRGDFKSFVFRRFKPTLEQQIPPTPTGGTYDNPIPDGGLWSDGLPPGNTSDGLIWASSRIFTDNGIQSAWSIPRVLSDNDTLDIEFSPGIGSDHTLPNNPEGPPFTNREDSGWYDPSSINFSLAGTMFWRAERKVQNGQYLGGWVVTRIIGENGTDGNGFEYIFKGFRTEQTSWNTDSDDYPPKWITSDANAFLGDDYRGPNGHLWADNAIGVNDTDNRFVYVCSRKKYVDEGASKATWHAFSVPKLWSQYIPSIPGPTGKNGSHTLFIYKTTSANLNDSSNYTELTTANSGANTSEANVPYGWDVSSTNPSSTSELIWGTHRLIEYNSSNEPIYRHWHTPPYTVSGKNGKNGKNGISLSSYILMLETWSDVVSVSGIYNEPTPNSGWSDGTPTNSNNYKYLWRRSRKMVLNSAGTDYEAETSNGSLTNEGRWKYVKLNGTDGTSIKVKGTVATVADLNNISNPSDGDAYKCEADGCLYVWSAEANSWVNLGQFKGDSGTTYYPHIAWARSVTLGTTPPGHTTTGLTTNPNASSVTNFSISPFDGAAWMGTLVNTVSTDSSDELAYTWVYVQGPAGATTATSVYQLVATVSEIRYKRNHAGVVVWMPPTFDLKLFKFEGNSFSQISQLPSGYSILRIIDGTNTESTSLGTVRAPDLASYSNNGSLVIGNTVSIEILKDGVRIAILELPIVREFLRMLIPMGAYVNKRYDMTDTTVPLVLGSNGKYYYLVADTNRVNGTNIDPTTDGQTVWEEATQFEVILTKALFADFAKLGSFVVYDKYFFSLFGYLYNSDGSYSMITTSSAAPDAYANFDPNDPMVEITPSNWSLNGWNKSYKFKPAKVINAETGEEWSANGNVHMGSDGSVSIKGNIEATSLIAGNTSGLNITTTGTAINFNEGNDTRAYFTSEKSGLLLYIKNPDDLKWYKIDFGKWDLVGQDVTFTAHLFFTVNNTTNSINFSEVVFPVTLYTYNNDWYLNSSTTASQPDPNTIYYERVPVSTFEDHTTKDSSYPCLLHRGNIDFYNQDDISDRTKDICYYVMNFVYAFIETKYDSSTKQMNNTGNVFYVAYGGTSGAEPTGGPWTYCTAYKDSHGGISSSRANKSSSPLFLRFNTNYNNDNCTYVYDGTLYTNFTSYWTVYTPMELILYLTQIGNNYTINAIKTNSAPTLQESDYHGQASYNFMDPIAMDYNSVVGA